MTIVVGLLVARPLTALALGPVYLPAVPVCLSALYIAILTATNRQARITGSVVLGGITAIAANVMVAAIASGRGIVENLSVVATIKVMSMVVLLVLNRVA